MRNSTVFIMFISTATLSFAQGGQEIKQVSIQSNGVIVNESAGNEGFVVKSTPASPVIRTINDWTLPECIDALRALDEKLAYLENVVANEQRRLAYLEQKTLVENRKELLMSTH